MSESESSNLWEVTLLGRGVGECVLVRLGSGRWIIVDSFEIGGQPAAQVYLDRLGVPRSAVAAIVVSHFHADHYRGLKKLHAYYADAQLFYTSALKEDNFRALWGNKSRRKLLVDLPLVIKRAKARACSEGFGSIDLKSGSEVFVRSEFHIKAIAPTDAAVAASNTELGAVIEKGDRDDIDRQLQDDNRSCVVLHIETSTFAVLLGSDLVAVPREYGWQAVAMHPNHAVLKKASYVKIPHHGSSRSHSPEMWGRLVGERPVTTVAPYWPSRLPWPSDVERLVSLGGAVWQAAPSFMPLKDEFGNDRDVARLGGVSARWDAEIAGWAVESFGAAFQIETVSED